MRSRSRFVSAVLGAAALALLFGLALGVPTLRLRGDYLAIATLGIWLGSFWTLVLGTLVLGTYNAFGQYYRFAAADGIRFEARAAGEIVDCRRVGPSSLLHRQVEIVPLG